MTWTHEPISDVWKTSEIIIAGTLAASSRYLFQVRTNTLRYNERPDLTVALARALLTMDYKDADIVNKVLFTQHQSSPLVEAVRRHNAVLQVSFTLENLTASPILLDTVNGVDDTGQTIPAGLMIMLHGEPGAPLWEPGQLRIAQTAVANAPGAFTVKNRFNALVNATVTNIT